MTKEEGKEKTRGFVIAVPEICILEKKKKKINLEKNQDPFCPL